jgi:hypothetical protein
LFRGLGLVYYWPARVPTPAAAAAAAAGGWRARFDLRAATCGVVVEGQNGDSLHPGSGRGRERDRGSRSRNPEGWLPRVGFRLGCTLVMAGM